MTHQIIRCDRTEAIVDFTKNALPLGTQSEMASYSLAGLVGSFHFVTAHSAGFFDEGANRIERFLVDDGDLVRLVKENHALCS